MKPETTNIFEKILFCWNNGIQVKPFGLNPNFMRLVILKDGKKAKLIDEFFTIETFADRMKNAYAKIYDKLETRNPKLETLNQN